MSEHVHSLDVYCDEWGVARIHCTTCNGFDELWTDFQARQEQQLAQAREDVEHWKKEYEWKDGKAQTLWQEYKKHEAWEAQAGALLEEWLTALEDAGYLSFVYENRCRWCHSTTQHHDFCLLARSRAFLAAHPHM